MFSLTLPTAPRWLDLPHGIRVQVKPIDGLVRAAAEASVHRTIREAEAERTDRIEVGAGVADLVDLADADMRRAFISLTFAAKLARYGIVAWEGIEQDHTGDLAEQLMLQQDTIAEAFIAAYLAPVAALAAEGNASAPAPNGSSAGAPITAEAAPPPAPPAPKS
jgi:hypothetical protein